MLYDALYDWLVETGPLESLYWQRMPIRDVSDVSVSIVITPGAGATKSFGSREIDDPNKPWLEHDGGIEWFHTGIIFQARCEENKELLATSILDDVRDRMLMLVGVTRTLPIDISVPPYDSWERLYGRPAQQENINWAELTNNTNLLQQDKRERLVFQLLMECWHSPVR